MILRRLRHERRRVMRDLRHEQHYDGHLFRVQQSEDLREQHIILSLPELQVHWRRNGAAAGEASNTRGNVELTREERRAGK